MGESVSCKSPAGNGSRGRAGTWCLPGQRDCARVYVCSKCGYELFSSQAKYEHSSPWPAFTQTVHTDSVSKYEERPGALKVSCGKCGNGLGHEFLNDGPKKGQSRF
uniref:Methionine sulfoxide reductase B1 n=1 Tax=Crocodylus porosus TaxID=8502 RepID=A0A7M4FAC7_CROPO